MHRSLAAIPLWTLGCAAAASGIVAVYFERSSGLVPGLVAGPVLLAVTVASALTGRRSATFTIAGLAALILIFECVSSRVSIELPLLEALTINAFVTMAVGWLVSGVVTGWHEEIAGTRARLEKVERELFRRNRESNVDAAVVSESEPTENRVDQAMLLLTIQEVGRRVTGNLDPKTLVSTITTTACGSLRADSCRLFLYRDGRLEDASDEPRHESARYRPGLDRGATKWVLENRRVLTRDALENDFELRHLRDEDPHAPEGLAPLVTGDELVGLLVVEGVQRPVSNLARMLYVLGDIYALGIRNALLFERIETMARRDGLTGLLNHASFLHDLGELAEAADRDGTALGVIMSDIDHFKRFNDTYGHQAGDHVLREVARVWGAVFGDEVVIGRYGGEEYIAALPGLDVAEVTNLAETLRSTIEEFRFDYEGQPLKVTASFGVSMLRSDGETPTELVGRADALLYEAKKGGRNRVAVEAKQDTVSSVVAETSS